MNIISAFSLIIFTFVSCTKDKSTKINTLTKATNFEVNIKHFYSTEGENLNWIIRKDSLKIKYNCDFEGCNDTLLFSSTIDTTTANLYFKKIIKIPLNDLKGNHDNILMQDGLKENIIIKNTYDAEIKISVHGKQFQEIDKLYKLTDSLILHDTKFKISPRK